MRTILASFGSCEGFRWFAESVERACDVLGERLSLWPVSTVNEVRKAVTVRNPVALALDPAASGTLGPEDPSLLLETVAILGRDLSPLPLLLLDTDGIVDAGLRTEIEDLGVQVHFFGAEEAGTAACATKVIELLGGSPEEGKVEVASDGTARAPLAGEQAPAPDQTRFRDLYNTYRRTCSAGALRRGASLEDAEEVVQNVFAREWKRRMKVRERRYTKSYFDRAGWNEADHVMKKHERRRRVGRRYLADKRTRMETYTSPDISGSHTDTEAVRAAIDALPEPQRAIARLCMIEEWSSQRGADLLSVPVKRIEHYRRQARELLKTALGGLRQEGSA